MNKSKKNKQQKRQMRRKGPSTTGFDRTTGYLIKPRMTGVLTYGDTFSLSNLGSAGVNGYTYRANSIYDPNFTATGTTAFGVTQLSQLYDKYRVTHCRAEIDVATLAGTVGGEIFVVASNNNALATGVGAWSAQRFVKRRPIGSINGNGICKISVAFPISLVYGVTRRQVMTEDDFGSVMGNNPANVVYLHIGYLCNTTASTATVTVTTRFFFTTVLSLPVTLAA